MVLVFARVPLPYQPSVMVSQVWRRKSGGGSLTSVDVDVEVEVEVVGKSKLRRHGSVISQNIHIRPSRGRGGWPVKICEVLVLTGVVVLTEPSGAVVVVVEDAVARGSTASTSGPRGTACRLPPSRATSGSRGRMRNMAVW